MLVIKREGWKRALSSMFIIIIIIIKYNKKDEEEKSSIVKFYLRWLARWEKRTKWKSSWRLVLQCCAAISRRRNGCSYFPRPISLGCWWRKGESFAFQIIYARLIYELLHFAKLRLFAWRAKLNYRDFHAEMLLNKSCEAVEWIKQGREEIPPWLAMTLIVNILFKRAASENIFI